MVAEAGMERCVSDTTGQWEQRLAMPRWRHSAITGENGEGEHTCGRAVADDGRWLVRCDRIPVSVSLRTGGTA